MTARTMLVTLGMVEYFLLGVSEVALDSVGTHIYVAIVSILEWLDGGAYLGSIDMHAGIATQPPSIDFHMSEGTVGVIVLITLRAP